MKTRIETFLKKSLFVAFAMCSWFTIFDDANAAERIAVRNSPSTRRTITTNTRQANNNVLTTTQQSETTPATEPEPTPVVAKPDPEPIIIENKTNQFNDVLSESGASSRDATVSNMAELIKKQRAAFEAKENAEFVQQEQQKALATGKNACDSGLRKCMSETCGANFTKCALDGDTIFGEKLNRCRRETTCTGEEFRLFTTEIKADRDFNVQMASFTSVLECGNSYNSCIQTECGATFNKCLGKTAADKAIKKCSAIAKNCTEQDSGLASRMGTVIGKLRENAEKDVKTDEARLYELRDLMRKQCEHLGAMFDERSFDCVYTINFFAGTNQSSPMASRKAYAGSSFVCNQEWFGINATTFKENAYRETRSQTAASSAMLGSGLGTATGLITSNAIGRALETQQAKKDYKKECKEQGGKLKDGECVMKGDAKYDDDTPEDTDNSKAEARAKCKENGGKYILGKCWGGNKSGDDKGENPTTPTDDSNTPSLGFENKGLSYDKKSDAKNYQYKAMENFGKDYKFETGDMKTGNSSIDAQIDVNNAKVSLDKAAQKYGINTSSTSTPSSQSGSSETTLPFKPDTSLSKPSSQIGGSATSGFGKGIGTRK